MSDCAQQVQWITVVASTAGALVGGLVAALSSLLFEWAKSKREAKRVEGALVAEVAGILAAVERRGFVADVRRVIAELEKRPPGTPYAFQVRVNMPVGPIYHAHLDKLGLLPIRHAARFVEFYQSLESVALDVSENGVVAKGAQIELFRQDLQILEHAIALGGEIVDTARG